MAMATGTVDLEALLASKGGRKQNRTAETQDLPACFITVDGKSIKDGFQDAAAAYRRIQVLYPAKGQPQIIRVAILLLDSNLGNGDDDES